MSLINLLPQKIKEELRNKSLLKVISGLNNFDVQSVKIIVEAASLGGADLVDIASTYAIHQEFKKQSLNIPIMSASGLSQVTCPLAISSGASAVGVGSVVNKLDDLISMIAVVRGLKESLKNSIIGEKIS